MTASAISNLDPNNSPSAQVAAGVKRVNNWPLFLIFAAFGLFLVIIMLVAADRSAQQDARSATTGEEKVGKAATALAEDITRGYESGFIEADVVAEPTPLDLTSPDTGAPTLADASSPAELSPEVQQIISDTSPGTSRQNESLPKDAMTSEDERRITELQRRIQEERLRRFELAVTAKTAVTGTGGSSARMGGSAGMGSAGSATGRNGQLQQLDEIQRQLMSANAQLANSDPIATYQARLASLQGSGLTNSGIGAAPALANRTMASARLGNADQNAAYGQFDGTQDRWQLDSSLDAPQTPYVLRAGFVVPGIMISGVNSDLPGQLQAQVSQDVYDTATGSHVLIPQGSRLVGSYASNVTYGQERVMVAWQRIVFPDGKAMDIGAMQGADGAGYSGFKDQVNHHFWRIFGSAFMMSVVVAGVELSQDDGGSGFGQERKAGDALSEALGQQLGQATSQMIQKNLNIAPTIEIRPGYRFNIMVSKDMVFTKPYQSFDY